MLSNELNISPSQPAHLQDIISLADHELGKGYLDEEELKPIGSSWEQRIFVASYKDTLIGFSRAEILTARQAEEKMLILPEVFRMSLMKHQKLAYRRQTIVDKAWRNKGIGSALALKLEESLRQESDMAFSVVWRTKNGMSTILKSLGYELLACLPDYWYTDSLKRKYSCPACGQPPCHCTAELYIKPF